MNKCYILLKLYDRLRAGLNITIADCCGRYEISVATFRRYIAFLRGYFGETCGRDLIYDAEAGVYRLKEKA